MFVYPFWKKSPRAFERARESFAPTHPKKVSHQYTFLVNMNPLDVGLFWKRFVSSKSSFFFCRALFQTKRKNLEGVQQQFASTRLWDANSPLWFNFTCTSLHALQNKFKLFFQTHCKHTAIHCHTLQRRKAVTAEGSMQARLLCLATHCNTLQHTATHCNTLQHKKSFTAKASVQARLLRPRTHCNTLQHTATQEISHRWSIQASETPTPWHTNLMAGSIHLWYSAGMLYVCGAVSCSELQRVAVCRRAHSPWSTPPDAVCVWCSELQWVAACCSVL